MKILGSPASGCDFMVVASSTLCNLLLEFSPSKEPILELGAIDLLCSLTHKYEPALVLNGVWGLMVSMYNRLLLKHTNNWEITQTSGEIVNVHELLFHRIWLFNRTRE